MRFESYSQELEDLILSVVLQDVTDGFYIDVGANDPTALSVTKHFYLKGWHGINIEPLKDKCLLLEEQRPRDINLCVGISNQKETRVMFEGGTGTTFDPEVAKNDGISKSGVPKEMLTLSDIHRRYCTPFRQIHFCKIDVEGFEKTVLESIDDWEAFRPWIYVMESAEPGTTIPSHKKWEHILLEHHYMWAFSFGINRYYLDIRREHLLPRFNDVVSFIRNNDVAVLTMSFVETD